MYSFIFVLQVIKPFYLNHSSTERKPLKTTLRYVRVLAAVLLSTNKNQSLFLLKSQLSQYLICFRYSMNIFYKKLYVRDFLRFYYEISGWDYSRLFIKCLCN